SNMVHQMKLHSVRYASEIAKADYPEIRQFWVPTRANLQTPLDSLSSGYWKSANPTDVRDFSAVAYFFAKKLYEKYHVPIGIVNASVGGTPIEAWMSEEGLKAYPALQKTIENNKDTTYTYRIEKANRHPNWEKIRHQDKGLNGPKPWYKTAYNPSSEQWRQIGIPGYWEDQGIRDLNGVVWYRKEIEVPSSMTGKPAKVFLGRIV